MQMSVSTAGSAPEILLGHIQGVLQLKMGTVAWHSAFLPGLPFLFSVLVFEKGILNPNVFQL